MSQNKENLNPKAYCLQASIFDWKRNVPLDRFGKPYRVGYRICKKFDCILPAHITQSRYIAKKVYGYLPPLYRAYSVEPMTYEELVKIAKPVDKDRAPRKCRVPGCNRAHRALNLCNAHHGQYYRYRQERGLTNRVKRDDSNLNLYVQPPAGNYLKAKDRYCHYPECDREYFARGFCKTHHHRWLRANGKDRTEKK